MKLSFMTFVCPDWKIEKVIDFAAEAGYDGVELRVDEGHKHGISSSSPKVDRDYVKRLSREKNVEIPCIATSVQFGFTDLEKRKSNVRSAKQNVELAGDLGAKVVRIFAGGDLAKLSQEAADYIAEAFTEVGDYAKQYGVCPMLETLHDIVKNSEDAMEVLNRVKSSNFGILWNHSDIDQKSFNILKDHIRHFHVHDEVLNTDNENVLHLAKKMKSVGFKGYVSLEIIKGHNLPENLLIETAKKLKGYIARA